MATEQDYGTGQLKLSLSEKLNIIRPYVSDRFLEQVKCVWIIISYLILFQLIVLRLPIVYSLMIAVGMGVVILGLMFFMEGLTLGLMPFGEVIGAVLPRKAHLFVILLFGFIIGIMATFAEPAISVLKSAGKNVQPLDAPLLYCLLNDFSGQLVTCVGIGVGIAVVFGVLRFLYGWSLKVLIFPLIIILLAVTSWAHLIDVLRPIIGLAWDCGAVTTGPVTVPLVLALGIGVCRVVGSADNDSAGFGVVTMASLFPIIAVLSLGIFHYHADDYYGRPNYKPIKSTNNVTSSAEKERSQSDFKEMAMTGYTEKEINEFYTTGKIPEGSELTYKGEEKTVIGGKILMKNAVIEISKKKSGSIITDNMNYWDPESNIVMVLKNSVIAALRALIPLCLFLFIFLKFVLREKVPHGDEISLGILFAVIGFAIFYVGIELGLTPLGEQLGSNVPSAFAMITPLGLEGYQGPLYGEGFSGKLVAILFAFVLGYGATLAEPALNALGATVEKITVGAFKKGLLMQAVAIGVAMGIALGIVKIAYNVPLTYLLIPPYIVLLVLTYFSKESFVNIGWDSAGVTTGPITVPLVLAMGLGVGGKVPDVIEGFGVLSMASVMPILSVLTVGLMVRRNTADKGQKSQAEGNDHE